MVVSRWFRRWFADVAVVVGYWLLLLLLPITHKFHLIIRMAVSILLQQKQLLLFQ